MYRNLDFRFRYSKFWSFKRIAELDILFQLNWGPSHRMRYTYTAVDDQDYNKQAKIFLALSEISDKISILFNHQLIYMYLYNQCADPEGADEKVRIPTPPPPE